MPLSLEQIEREILEFPAAQRAELRRRLIAGLDDGDAEPGCEEAWRIEALRRAEEIESGKVACIDGEEVFREIGAELGSAVTASIPWQKGSYAPPPSTMRPKARALARPS